MHRAEWFNDALVVVGGGFETLSSEACTLSVASGKFECVNITPTLRDYKYGVSFVVDFECAFVTNKIN